MERRRFCFLIAASGMAYVSTRLTGCGPTGALGGQGNRLTDDETQSGSASRADTVLMSDIQIYAQYMDGTTGPKTGVLKVSAILANTPVTLNHFDPHGHTYTLTPEHYAKLKRGEALRIKTTVADGHDHIVLVNPKTVVPGSQQIAVPLDSNPIDAPSDKLFIALDENDTPNLMVSGNVDLDADSVQYCIDAVERCRADGSLWRGMKLDGTRTDKQIFISNMNSVLDQAREKYPAMLRGKAKVDGRVVERLFQFISKR